MARPTVVDYSWAKPDPACLRGSGYVGVMRYLSWDPTKNLTRTEAIRLHGHGLWIGLNWEGHGNWSEFSTGAAGGSRAGTEAARQCAALGAPRSVPIFCSADYGAPAAHWPTIEAWLRAFGAASGHVVGFYGQGNLIDWLLTRDAVRWAWQTNATGWGGVSTRAVLRQHLWTTVCGASVDPNTLIGDPHEWAWMPASKEDDMTPAQAAQLAQAAAASTTAAAQSHAATMYAGMAVKWSATAAITGIYEHRLGRAPDAQGLEVWADQALKGATWEQIDAAIAASPEAVRHRSETTA